MDAESTEQEGLKANPNRLNHFLPHTYRLAYILHQTKNFIVLFNQRINFLPSARHLALLYPMIGCLTITNKGRTMFRMNAASEDLSVVYTTGGYSLCTLSFKTQIILKVTLTIVPIVIDS